MRWQRPWRPCAAFTKEFDAIVARQRAECEAIIEQQRDECKAIIAHLRAEYAEHQRVAMEQFKHDLLAKVENMIEEVEAERAALRRELTAAHAELARLRPREQPLH